MFTSMLCRKKLEALYAMVSNYQLSADEGSEAEEFLIALRKELDDKIASLGGHLSHREQMEGFNRP